MALLQIGDWRSLRSVYIEPALALYIHIIFSLQELGLGDG